jgi:hypothetical protein
VSIASLMARGYPDRHPARRPFEPRCRRERGYRQVVAVVRNRWARLALGAAGPIAVSAAWIPIRDRVSNTDLALALVLVIGTVGWLDGARAALLSAPVAATAFDVLDTRPYGTLAMSRGSDVATAIVLAVTGFLVGAGFARLAQYRRNEEGRTDALAVVMEASGLVATGEEKQLITEVLRAELQRALALAGCEFVPTPPDGRYPAVARDGSLVGLVGSADESPPRIDLPIWCQGDVVAHYRLLMGPRQPSRDELRMALGLADQAGSAMAQADDPTPPPTRPRRLRLVPGGSRGTQSVTDGVAATP